MGKPYNVNIYILKFCMVFYTWSIIGFLRLKDFVLRLERTGFQEACLLYEPGGLNPSMAGGAWALYKSGRM